MKRHPLIWQAVKAVIQIGCCLSVVVHLTHVWWVIVIALLLQLLTAWQLVSFGVRLADAHPERRVSESGRAG